MNTKQQLGCIISIKKMKTKNIFYSLISFIYFIVMGCASFSSMRPADIKQGISFHIKGGLSNPPGRETYWFYDFGSDCPLCFSKPIAISEIGLNYGFKPYSLGVLMNGFVPQLELYRQLHEGDKSDYGFGGRLGIPIGWHSHQLYFVYHKKMNDHLKVMFNPGLFYHTGQSPNGANTGSLLFFTQGIGLAIESNYITFLPGVAFIGGKGELSISDEPKRRFNDFFMTFSLALTIHRKVN